MTQFTHVIFRFHAIEIRWFLHVKITSMPVEGRVTLRGPWRRECKVTATVLAIKVVGDVVFHFDCSIQPVPCEQSIVIHATKLIMSRVWLRAAYQGFVITLPWLTRTHVWAVTYVRVHRAKKPLGIDLSQVILGHDISPSYTQGGDCGRRLATHGTDYSMACSVAKGLEQRPLKRWVAFKHV